MIIIWGKSIKNRFQGVVADRCVLCQSITKATVEGVYAVSHLYYIPLGYGELVQNQNRCHSCGGVVVSEPQRYDRLLGKGDEKGLSTLEILERTNSLLANEVKRRGALEHSAGNYASASEEIDPEEDPRLHLTWERLSEIPPEDEGFADHLEKAKNWAKLEEPQRRVLVAKVAERHKAAEYQRNVVTHIYWATQKFTPSQWGWAGVLFIALAVLGFSLFTPKAQRGGDDGAYVLYILGGSLVASLILMVPFHRWLHRRFFRRVFVPQAEERGIRPEDSLAWLEEYHAAVKSGAIQPTVDEVPLRDLAKVHPRLREVIARQPSARDSFDQT